MALIMLLLSGASFEHCSRSGSGDHAATRESTTLRGICSSFLTVHREDHTAGWLRKGCQLANTPGFSAGKPSIISKVGSPVLKKKKKKELKGKKKPLKHSYILYDHVKDKCILAPKTRCTEEAFYS